jgi:hypothetical protein
VADLARVAGDVHNVDDLTIAPVDSPAVDAVVARIAAAQCEREVLASVGRLQATSAQRRRHVEDLQREVSAR